MDSAEIEALAQEVATSPEFQAPPTELPSSITLYRTGRVLYACASTNTPLTDTFDKLLTTLGEQYVRTILHQLHVAYANLIVSFASNSATTSAVPAATSLIPMMARMTSYAAKMSASSKDDVIEATESLCGIYLASQTACRCCGDFERPSLDGQVTELDIVFASFSWVYDYILQNPSVFNVGMGTSLLTTISRILTQVVFSCASNDENEDEQLTTIMNIVQRIQLSGGEYSCIMGDMLQMEERRKQDESFVNSLSKHFSDGPQLQYTLAMLRGFPRSDSQPPSKSQSKVKTQQVSIPTPPQQNITDIKIANVQSVLPDLGAGFIEEALKVYNNNVERTIDALLQLSDGSSASTIHPQLASLPRNLPRKLKDLPEQYTTNVNMHRGATDRKDGEEHVARQKAYIKQVERKAEEEAYLVENVSRALGGLRVGTVGTSDGEVNGDNEYDDDYDDQYDGIGDDGGMAGGIGGMDEGLYDVDVHNVHQKFDRGGARNEQDMWREYNRLIKDVDAESQFWEESRNTNRQGNHKGNKPNNNGKTGEEDMYDDDDGEKKYRGPDKGRGGRLIGPDGKYLPTQRGGKKGRGNSSAAAASGDNGNSGRGGRGGRTGGRGGRGGAGRGKTTTDKNQEGQKKEGDNSDLSKIQKRRKNDNKAKIGNHHRRDRAVKKAAGGMMF